MPQPQHIPARQRVGDRAIRTNLRSSVGAVDPPDEHLQLIESRTGFSQQRGSVLRRLLAFLVPRTPHNPRPQLLNPARGVGPQRQALREPSTRPPCQVPNS